MLAQSVLISDKIIKILLVKNKLTHSFERYEKIQNAPYQIPSVTFGWVHATFQAMDEIFLPKAIKNLNTDVFIMGSPDDQVVDPSAWQKWVLKSFTD
ncbi:MAG: hypothetical protein R3B45_07945 [Bdellovibrionota bacterium]